MTQDIANRTQIPADGVIVEIVTVLAGSVLQVDHLSGPAAAIGGQKRSSFVVGSDAEVDLCTVDVAHPAHTLLHWRADGPLLSLAPGMSVGRGGKRRSHSLDKLTELADIALAEPLAEPTEVPVPEAGNLLIGIGQLRLLVRLVEAERRHVRPPRQLLERRIRAFALTSALLHAAVLVVFFSVERSPLSPQMDANGSAARAARIVELSTPVSPPMVYSEALIPPEPPPIIEPAMNDALPEPAWAPGSDDELPERLSWPAQEEDRPRGCIVGDVRLSEPSFVRTAALVDHRESTPHFRAMYEQCLPFVGFALLEGVSDDYLYGCGAGPLDGPVPMPGDPLGLLPR